MNRRKFITVAGVRTIAIGGVAYFINDSYQHKKYEDIVNTTWRHSTKFDGSNMTILAALVRYATLVANSHNTQPWYLKIGDTKITIGPKLPKSLRRPLSEVII